MTQQNYLLCYKEYWWIQSEFIFVSSILNRNFFGAETYEIRIAESEQLWEKEFWTRMTVRRHVSASYRIYKGFDFRTTAIKIKASLRGNVVRICISTCVRIVRCIVTQMQWRECETTAYTPQNCTMRVQHSRSPRKIGFRPQVTCATNSKTNNSATRLFIVRFVLRYSGLWSVPVFLSKWSLLFPTRASLCIANKHRKENNLTIKLQKDSNF